MIDQASIRAACLVVMDLPDILKTTRGVRSLSQAQAAPEIGISQSTLEHIECGAGIRSDTLLLVLNWIIGGEETS